MVLGLASDETDIDLLQDDGDLEHPEDVVPVDGAQIEAGRVRVALDRPGAVRKAFVLTRHGGTTIVSGRST